MTFMCCAMEWLLTLLLQFLFDSSATPVHPGILWTEHEIGQAQIRPAHEMEIAVKHRIQTQCNVTKPCSQGPLSSFLEKAPKMLTWHPESGCKTKFVIREGYLSMQLSLSQNVTRSRLGLRL